MKLSQRRSIRVFLALATAAQLLAVGFVCTSAQTSRRKPRVKYYSVPANQTMRVRLNQELNSETARVGDTFTSTVVDPVYSSGGVLVVPQGSIVTGAVTNVVRAQKNGKPATMDVVFSSIRLPNSRRVAISGSLTDLSTSNSSSDNEGTVAANKTSKRKLKFIGGGAAGGALIGAIAGGGKGLLIGAGVGALTGGITGRLKKGHEVKVKSGTEFGVILNRSFALPKYVGA
jgi:YMGG-like Gly-zipper